MKIFTVLLCFAVAVKGWGNIPNDSAIVANSFPPGEYVNITDYTAYKKGADWSPAFKRAFADCNQIYVPAGHYSCSEIRLSSNESIWGANGETIFMPLSDHLFVIEGDIGSEIKIIADIDDFTNTILLERAGGLKAGDDILIRGQRNSMLREGIKGVNYSPDWVLGRTRKSSCFFGEMDVVASVAGAKITTGSNRLFPDYFKDNSREPQGIGEGFLSREATTVSKLSMVKNASLRNFSIIGTSTCFMPIKLGYSKDCTVENITFNTSVESFKSKGKEDLSIVYGLYAWNTVIRNFKAILSPGLLAKLKAKEKIYSNFSNYNLFKMISSTNSGFENCYANGGCHAFSITRSASPKGRGGIPSVNCYIRDCSVSDCIWSGVTVQQGCYRTDVSRNVVTAGGQGIITGGRNTTITNNSVSTNLPYSTEYYYTHIDRGGTLGIGIIEGASCGSIIKNNTVSGFYTGIGIVDGYEKKNCFEEGNITVESNNILECMRGFSLYKNDHCMTLGRNNLKIKICDNSFLNSKTAPRPAGSEKANTYGIYLPNISAGITISNNTFNNFGCAVWMDRFVDYIAITDNRIGDSNYGIVLTDISDNPENYDVHIRLSDNTLTGTPTKNRGLDQNKVVPFRSF